MLPLVQLRQEVAPPAPAMTRTFTGSYLNAVKAATVTVASWLKSGNTDEVPSPVAAAVGQLRDEPIFKRDASEVTGQPCPCLSS